jgi:hypothetical protein
LVCCFFSFQLLIFFIVHGLESNHLSIVHRQESGRCRPVYTGEELGRLQCDKKEIYCQSINLARNGTLRCDAIEKKILIANQSIRRTNDTRDDGLSSCCWYGRSALIVSRSEMRGSHGWCGMPLVRATQHNRLGRRRSAAARCVIVRPARQV